MQIVVDWCGSDLYLLWCFDLQLIFITAIMASTPLPPPSTATPDTRAGPRKPLPHLPVPEVGDTLYRWLVSVAPLATEADFRRAALAAARFAASSRAITGGSGSGSEDGGGALTTAAGLQAALRAKATAAAAVGKSWLIDDWVRLMYTGWRDALPVNVSYWFLFDAAVFARVDDALVGTPRITVAAARAAACVTAFGRLRDAHAAGRLPAEPAALDPSMFRYLFHACRLPRAGVDGVRVYDGAGGAAPHNTVVVLRKHRLYVVRLPADGSVATLAADLTSVAAAADADATGSKAPDVGILTACHRDTWAGAFVQIFGPAAAGRPSHGPEVAADGDAEARYAAAPPPGGPPSAVQRANTEVLEAIEACLAVVCLDDGAPGDVEAASRALLTGDGGNRWFDKAIQFVVADNGAAGLIGEHSHSDGAPVAHLTAWLLGHIRRGDVLAPLPATPAALAGGGARAWARLVIDVPPGAVPALADARRQFEALSTGHALRALVWREYGADAAKSAGVSPDAWAQMAIQLAYHRWRGVTVPTYEPAQARAFKWGRTACIRVVTSASTAWVRAMATYPALPPSAPTPAAAHAALRAAGAVHTANSRAAAGGQDVDRHLLGLKLVWSAGRAAAGLPPVGTDAASAFLTDPLLPATATWKISTSNLTVAGVANWGWGEVTSGGIGVAYSVHRDHLTFNVVGEAATGIDGFVACLPRVLADMASAAALAATAAPTRRAAKL